MKNNTIPDGYVNNHIHTVYSFSPYSPAEAIEMARAQGLVTAGIMDHDTVAGVNEFLEAGRLSGIAATAGFECRCLMKDTPFGDLRLNNPDQDGISYVACHGIPRQNLDTADLWLAPYREKRNIRNRAMVKRINELLKYDGLFLDFDTDVLPLTMHRQGGTVTERHLLYALALKIMDVCDNDQTPELLKNRFGIAVSDKDRERFSDADKKSLAYSLLGILKGNFVESFYIDAGDECPSIFEFVKFVSGIGAIAAYAYLGDVVNSVTGDKRAQSFEDSYLDELIGWLAENGFHSVTYMPTRNTPAQLQRIIGLCEKHDLFQISGEDINSPNQSFICEALKYPEYRHLIESTWALIGHEKAATDNIEEGMFRPKTIGSWPGLHERIKHFAEIGRKA